MLEILEPIFAMSEGAAVTIGVLVLTIVIMVLWYVTKDHSPPED